MSEGKRLSVEELIQDESFINWIKLGTDATQWENLLKEHADLHPVVAEARYWVLELSFTDEQPTVAEEIHLLQRIKATIQQQNSSSTIRRIIPQWLKVAAMLSGIIISALAAYWTYSYYSFKHIETGAGQITKIILPDSSEITLNANTKVKYERSWSKDQPRELWIDGEGFFNVKHLNKDQHHIKTSERFIVHTADMNIQVLGTSFNVNTRRNRTKVVLTTGKIQLTLKDNKESIVMAPGDAVTYSPIAKAVIKNTNTLNPTISSAWKEHHLVFVESNIQEIAEQLEDNTGCKVIVNAPSLNQKTISGSVSTQNQEVLIKVLADLLNVDITKNAKENTILIQEKN